MPADSFKAFRGETPAEVEAQANEWIAAHPEVSMYAMTACLAIPAEGPAEHVLWLALMYRQRGRP